MFGTRISLVDKDDYHAEKFELAYQFLRRLDLADLPEGSVPLGLGVVAHVQHYSTTPASALKFETHEKYFDVQYMVSGMEMFGLVDYEGLDVDVEYNTGTDIAYYKEPSSFGSLLLCEGEFIIVGPEEAHKPRCCVDLPLAVIKIVVKVPVSIKI
ncbi:MAG: YhcH/YjgK/YiaL family protein [Mobilitalea sp.]